MKDQTISLVYGDLERTTMVSWNLLTLMFPSTTIAFLTIHFRPKMLTFRTIQICTSMLNHMLKRTICTNLSNSITKFWKLMVFVFFWCKIFFLVFHFFLILRNQVKWFSVKEVYLTWFEQKDMENTSKGSREWWSICCFNPLFEHC